MAPMVWQKLLQRKRLCDLASTNASGARSDFQRDFDRIIFSSAFRRLQDKTQVFPLARSDYVRTRLTHSLEVSSVGRSLGIIVGNHLASKGELPEGITPDSLGFSVASACLAHDIGNPPFGHAGEEAIQSWFESDRLEGGKALVDKLPVRKGLEFQKFEGNAQGFRVLTKLQYPENKGGLSLTHTTLAAYSKYPQCVQKPLAGQEIERVSEKKFNVLASEVELFSEVAANLGLIQKIGKENSWCRHPLAFLVEAADDICYRIIDFEDGYRLGYVDYSEISELFTKITDNGSDAARKAELKRKLDGLAEQKSKVELLRANCINNLIYQVTREFIANEAGLLNGTYDKALIESIPSWPALGEISNQSRQKVYCARPVLEIEAAGFEVLPKLLNVFADVLFSDESERRTPPKYTKKLLSLFPQIKPANSDPYSKLLAITDFVSGMTDSFAVSTYKIITGISLPGF